MKLPAFENSSGKKDYMFTFAAISFFVVSAIVILSIFPEIKIGNFSLKFNDVNVPLITLYFGGCFTSYVIRRNKKDSIDPVTISYGEDK